MDGTLSDSVWEKAAVISDFTQQDPNEGEAPTEKTEVRILYTRTTLYFGIYCRDKHPQEILAKQLVRDGSTDADDQFNIVIDPTGSGQNGYFFSINPLGTQTDGLIGQEGEIIDTHWDGIWYSEAKIGKGGWTAEIAIPFITPNFGKKIKSIGINLERIIRRKQETDLWTAYKRYYGILKLSKEGILQGLNNINSTRLKVFKPYVLTGVQRNLPELYSLFATGGFDYSQGLTDNVLGRITYNTDFSETPPDAEQINLNSFPLFIPESRPFFLEREDIFNFGFPGFDQLFFSRNIGIDVSSGAVLPILGGIKATGSLSDYDLGALAISERSTSLNFASSYFVGRIKKRFSSGSYVGIMAVKKKSQNPADPFNNSYGTDFSLNFLDSLFNVAGYFEKSDSPSMFGKNWGAAIDASYKNEWVYAELLKHESLPNYNPEAGFREFEDDNTDVFNVYFKARPKILQIRELEIGEHAIRVFTTEGSLQLSQIQPSVSMRFNSGAEIYAQPWETVSQVVAFSFQPAPGIAVVPGLYTFSRHHVHYLSDPTKVFSFFVMYDFGQYYSGNLNTLKYDLTLHPSQHIAITYSRETNMFRFPYGKADVLLESIGINYAFSRFLNAGVLTQSDSAAPHPTSINMRLQYRFRPDSDFFIIYNLGPQFVSSITGTSQEALNQKLIVKFTYAYF